MEQIKLTINEAIFYASVAHAIIGFLLGLIPLILGFIKKERSYAVFGFLGSIIGGAILGLLLSLPIAVIFIWLILRKPEQSAEVGGANEVPVDVKVEDSETR
ncbi:MAG: hypothetical protein LH472_03640 [Pyrinomonadaceae bacterium]|nr:hypothetical protein [Pyrinomonadaceae bacterium]